MDSDLRIGFLGAGKMATALARGWLEAGIVTADQVLASDPVAEARAHFAEQTGAATVGVNVAVVGPSNLLIIAVKPQNVPALLSEIQPHLRPLHLVISIAAGVTLGQLASGLGHDRRLVRVMPNTPCLVGASAAGYAAAATATAADLELVHRLLVTVGKAFMLPERLLDAVTGLSGSGPAYVFMMIEALSDGGVRAGLPRDVATQLAAQTVFGAAKMVLETNLHPSVLKDQVASPGGTTIAGIYALEKAGFRAALIDAVEAATRRAAELGTAETP
jgi:pyrroline-5-carboxylate reductase